MINQVIIVGRMTRDPELRYTPEGNPVANFTLAVNRHFKNASGEYDADFIHCHIWRKPAESTVNYCRKGSLVGVTGRMQSRSFENKEGQKVYVTEVVADRVQFLEPKKESVPS